MSYSTYRDKPQPNSLLGQEDKSNTEKFISTSSHLQSHSLASSNLSSKPSSNLTNYNPLLSPQRQNLLSNYSCGGVLSPSTPPVSRQRRHSKLHLRIASELSVDQGDCTYGLSSNASGSTKSVSGSHDNNHSSGINVAAVATTKSIKERYRIILMGSSAVGKTAIVEQFLYGSFPETHCSTVEELHKGEYEIAGGGYIPLEILDTSGSFEFPAMRRLAISTGDAFALVYAIDNQESFEEIKSIREMILQVRGEPLPPIVVVGNKADLDDDHRKVKMELAECECIDWEHGFVECSAKNNHNVVNIFSCMLLQARLKGTLNVAQIAASSSSRHVGYKDHADSGRHHQRNRRSSLPISELFHRHTSSRAETNSRSGATFRKRNSCTPQ